VLLVLVRASKRWRMLPALAHATRFTTSFTSSCS
jgi:hypothetical protein